MKIALVTTTINVPHVLRLYRAFGPEVRFFVALDKKLPAVPAWEHDLNLVWLDPAQQQYLYPRLSDLIGWNCIQRRNIATLEALRWGADVVISVDDDNAPLDGYFWCFGQLFGRGDTFNGLQISSPSGWYDPGNLLVPATTMRGFPHDKHSSPVVRPVVGQEVGVAQGLCLGDPDIGAVTRMALAPHATGITEIARAGITVDNRTWTVFNSQNTAMVRELIPAWFMPPGLGRFDDIVASLICQRVMRETGHVVHFGQPLVYQERNAHNLGKDLRDELWGMETLLWLAKILDDLEFGSALSALQRVRGIWVYLSACADWMPKQAVEAALAWCDDCEKVL